MARLRAASGPQPLPPLGRRSGIHAPACRSAYCRVVRDGATRRPAAGRRVAAAVRLDQLQRAGTPSRRTRRPTLARLPGITPQSTFAGLTYKDDSTLARLNRPRFREHLAARHSRRSRHRARRAAASSPCRRGWFTPAAPALAREVRPAGCALRSPRPGAHARHDARRWRGRRDSVRPGGYVVFEVPDATRALDRLDYTTVWEEHALYFTPTTLRRCLGTRPASKSSRSSRTPTRSKTSLVVIARSGAGSRTRTLPTSARRDRAGAAVHSRVPARPRARSSASLRDRGRVAMLGAGHLTGAFVNLYGLADRIDFVADDNPNKHGLFMPGSRLPILPSSELVDREIDLCLMTVRPEIEAAVAAKNAAFTARGGVLASVFPDSPFSLDRVARQRRGRGMTGVSQVNSRRVLVATGRVVQVTAADLAEFATAGPCSSRSGARRARIPTPADPLHEMLICLARGTYVRPHRHRGSRNRSTSSRANSTSCSFEDDGDDPRSDPDGAYESGCVFFYRLTGAVFHTVLVNTPHRAVSTRRRTARSTRPTPSSPRGSPAEDDPACVRVLAAFSRADCNVRRSAPRDAQALDHRRRNEGCRPRTRGALRRGRAASSPPSGATRASSPHSRAGRSRASRATAEERGRAAHRARPTDREARQAIEPRFPPTLSRQRRLRGPANWRSR